MLDLLTGQGGSPVRESGQSTCSAPPAPSTSACSSTSTSSALPAPSTSSCSSSSFSSAPSASSSSAPPAPSQLDQRIDVYVVSSDENSESSDAENVEAPAPPSLFQHPLAATYAIESGRSRLQSVQEEENLQRDSEAEDKKGIFILPFCHKLHPMS
jgi:hypothetical protein